MSKIKKYLPLIVLLVAIVADQWLKFYVKLNFTLGESVRVFDWFQILFVENPGMAFGWELGSKMFLTIFRIVVSGAVIWYLIKLMKDSYKLGYQLVVTLILAGALGNIIDCVSYGVIFSESTFYQTAELMPAAGGYATWFMGKVVDMFYFPLFTFPDWMPLLGGEIFFSPIFNLADSYITVAIFMLIIFYHKDFNDTIERYTKRQEK
ncbi:MAG: lipoprotein signal peptidase [Paludibacteraceae bacterium]|jgi:signal peptidase II|nr:lipoprotein signal peptidase [Paludibacteraceae bacterium]